MENKALWRWVDQISREWFGKPYEDEVMMNNRLRTTGGRYLPAHRRIELNPKYLSELGEEEFKGIIKHELCHYHLHIEGKGYQHRDPEFRALLKRTGSPRFCKALPSQYREPNHIYQCKECGYTYKRLKRVNTTKYRCGKCKGKLKKIE